MCIKDSLCTKKYFPNNAALVPAMQQLVDVMLHQLNDAFQHFAVLDPWTLCVWQQLLQGCPSLLHLYVCAVCVFFVQQTTRCGVNNLQALHSGYTAV